jgi:hypothetical protein
LLALSYAYCGIDAAALWFRNNVLPLPSFRASALRLRRRPAGVGEKGCGISASLAGCNDRLFKSEQRSPGPKTSSAKTMLKKYGLSAVGRAEHRAREMLRDSNPGGYDIWMKVAATIRQIRANAQAA